MERADESHCLDLAFSDFMWYPVDKGQVLWLRMPVLWEVEAVCELAIKIPDAVLYDTRMTKEQALSFAKRAIALGYYTQNGVSIGYCAQIAGMTEEDFIKYLGENHVSIFHFDDEAEFLEEMENA